MYPKETAEKEDATDGPDIGHANASERCWNAWRKIGFPRFVAAPMVDVSFLASRLQWRSHATQLAFTPMFHAGRFVNEAAYREDMFTSCPEDRPLVVQFCANKVETFAKAAELVQYRCDGVDLNLGCPQMIARRGRYGAFLQEDLPLVVDMISEASRRVSIPISAKIRILPDPENTLAYARKLKEAGCKWLTIHGRTRDQKGHNTGLADWSHIAYIKKHIDMPVIANGNILNREDAERCLEFTKADAVMSAEGILHNPAIFSPVDVSLVDVCEEFLSLCRCHDAAISHVRAVLFRVLKNCFEQMPGKLRENFSQCSTIDDCREICQQVCSAADQPEYQVETEGKYIRPLRISHARPRDKLMPGYKREVQPEVLIAPKKSKSEKKFERQLMRVEKKKEQRKKAREKRKIRLKKEQELAKTVTCRNCMANIIFCKSNLRDVASEEITDIDTADQSHLNDENAEKDLTLVAKKSERVDFSKDKMSQESQESAKIPSETPSEGIYTSILPAEDGLLSDWTEATSATISVCQQCGTTNYVDCVMTKGRRAIQAEVQAKIKDRLLEAMRGSAPKIVVDISLESTMSDKECGKLAQQIGRMYGANRNAPRPFHLCLVGFDERGKTYQECLRKHTGFEHYLIERHSEVLEELFPASSIVYLTPDASQPLQTLSREKVYVMGGLVDETVTKNVTLRKADSLKVETARLPIQEFMKQGLVGSFRKVRSINQVFDILLKFYESGKWSEALPCGIPRREGFQLKEEFQL